MQKIPPRIKLYSLLIALALAFTLPGAVVSFFSINNIINGKASLQWTETSGTIISSTVEKYVGAHKKSKYLAEVEYIFSVNGSEYKADTIRFGTMASLLAGELSETYSEGKTVKVFYNPNDPNIAVLEPGVNPGAWIKAVVAIFFCLSGLFLGTFFLKKLRKEMKKVTDQNNDCGSTST